MIKTIQTQFRALHWSSKNRGITILSHIAENFEWYPLFEGKRRQMKIINLKISNFRKVQNFGLPRQKRPVQIRNSKISKTKISENCLAENFRTRITEFWKSKFRFLSTEN